MAVYEHKRGYIAIIVSTLVVFGITLGFNGLAGSGTATGLFKNSTGDISAVYYTEITPAGWAFSIWGVIYLWQLAWLLYGLSTVCRTTSNSYLYVSPSHIPPIVYIIFMFNNVTNIAWLLLWGNFYPEYALMFLGLTTLSLYAILWISCRQLHLAAPVLLRDDLRKDIWLTRILLHNGIGLYAGWTTIATLINLDVVLAYSADIDQSIASTVCLAILLTAITTWLFLDTLLLDIYVRYLVSPYIAIFVALSGSIYKNWDFTKNNSALTAFSLAAAIFFAIVKLVLMTLRSKRKPIYSDNESIVAFVHTGSATSYSSLSKSFDKVRIP